MKVPPASVCVAFATAATVAYAALRLGSVLAGEPDPRVVGPSVHVAYFWRAGLAAWFGALAGGACLRFGWPTAPVTWQVVALIFSVTVALLVP